MEKYNTQPDMLIRTPSETPSSVNTGSSRIPVDCVFLLFHFFAIVAYDTRAVLCALITVIAIFTFAFVTCGLLQ